MHSARTDRPARPADAAWDAVLTHKAAPAETTGSARRSVLAGGRSALQWAMLGCGLVVLTACASGNADEAERGQAREAAASPVLAGAQATSTARQFAQPTPKPTKGPPPPPTLERLVITTGLGGDNAPQGSLASVPATAGTVYADALLHDLRDGQVIGASWTNGSGAVVSTSTVEVERDAAQGWIALPLGLNGSLAPGEYAVFLFANERRLSSVVFGVTGGGGPQAFAEPPANPSVDRGSAGVSGQGNDRGRQVDPNAPADGTGDGSGEIVPVVPDGGFDPNIGVQDPNTGFDPNTGVQNPNAGFDPNTGVQDPNAGFDPNAGLPDPNAIPEQPVFGDDGVQIVQVTVTP